MNLGIVSLDEWHVMPIATLSLHSKAFSFHELVKRVGIGAVFPPLNLFMNLGIVGLEEWHVMNIAPQGLHFLYLRGIHAETTD